MEDKTGQQIEPAIQNWPLTNLVVNVLGILAPAAVLAMIINYPTEIIDFLFNSRKLNVKKSLNDFSNVHL